MPYAATHARAAQTVKQKGAAITFTLTAPGTYDEATGTWTAASVTTVVGSAVQVNGDPERYRVLELIESEAPTLLFTPTTYGQLPPLLSTCVWGGVTYRVRDVPPLAPDGTAILARIVVSR